MSKVNNFIKRVFLFSIFISFVFIGEKNTVFAQNEDSDDRGWKVESRVGRIFYVTHGTVVAGHEFGLFKDPQACNDDSLWLSLSSMYAKVKDFEGKEVVFLFNIDGRIFKVKIPMLESNTLGSYQVMEFTNMSPEKGLMDALINGHVLKVNAVEPKNFEALMDIKQEQFRLVGFTASRKQAETECMNTRVL